MGIIIKLNLNKSFQRYSKMPKKSKKTSETINQKLALVFKSGKANLGYRSVKKCIRRGAAQLIFIANNCPTIRKQEIEYLCMLQSIKMVHYVGNNNELGTACGKMHRVSLMAIVDPGDSDILQ